MDYKELYPFILLLVSLGMLIGIGVLTLDKFGTSTYTTAYNNDSLLASEVIGNNTVIKLANSYLLQVISVKNATQGTLPTACYSVHLENGQYTFINQTPDCSPNPTNVSVYYSYKYFGEYRNATNFARDEVGNIASNWLGLIVTVFILAIILFFVIRSFGAGMGRN